MDFYNDMMLSHKYVQKKFKMWLKYDIEECIIESEYDPSIHLVNFVTIIKLVHVCENVGYLCCSAGKWFFDTSVSKSLH